MAPGHRVYSIRRPGKREELLGSHCLPRTAKHRESLSPVMVPSPPHPHTKSLEGPGFKSHLIHTFCLHSGSQFCPYLEGDSYEWD